MKRKQPSSFAHPSVTPANLCPFLDLLDPKKGTEITSALFSSTYQTHLHDAYETIQKGVQIPKFDDDDIEMFKWGVNTFKEESLPIEVGKLPAICMAILFPSKKGSWQKDASSCNDLLRFFRSKHNEKLEKEQQKQIASQWETFLDREQKRNLWTLWTQKVTSPFLQSLYKRPSNGRESDSFRNSGYAITNFRCENLFPCTFGYELHIEEQKESIHVMVQANFKPSFHLYLYELEIKTEASRPLKANWNLYVLFEQFKILDKTIKEFMDQTTAMLPLEIQIIVADYFKEFPLAKEIETIHYSG